MSGKKITDLKVADLRNHLDKRGLDKTGLKAVLLERLQKSLDEEGLDSSTYEFDEDNDVVEGTPQAKGIAAGKKAKRHASGDANEGENESDDDHEDDHEDEMESFDKLDESDCEVVEQVNGDKDSSHAADIELIDSDDEDDDDGVYAAAAAEDVSEDDDDMDDDQHFQELLALDQLSDTSLDNEDEPAKAESEEITAVQEEENSVKISETTAAAESNLMEPVNDDSGTADAADANDSEDHLDDEDVAATKMLSRSEDGDVKPVAETEMETEESNVVTETIGNTPVVDSDDVNMTVDDKDVNSVSDVSKEVSLYVQRVPDTEVEMMPPPAVVDTVTQVVIPEKIPCGSPIKTSTPISKLETTSSATSSVQVTVKSYAVGAVKPGPLRKPRMIKGKQAKPETSEEISVSVESISSSKSETDTGEVVDSKSEVTVTKSSTKSATSTKTTTVLASVVDSASASVVTSEEALSVVASASSSGEENLTVGIGQEKSEPAVVDEALVVEVDDTNDLDSDILEKDKTNSETIVTADDGTAGAVTGSSSTDKEATDVAAPAVHKGHDGDGDASSKKPTTVTGAKKVDGKAKSTGLPKKKTAAELAKDAKILAASRNLWVSGLSSDTRATDLKMAFSKEGKVVGAKVVTSARSPGSRCYGFVTMMNFEQANRCIQHLHKTELHGKLISVEKAKTEPGTAKKVIKPAEAKKEDGTLDSEKKVAAGEKDAVGEKHDEKRSDEKKDESKHDDDKKASPVKKSPGSSDRRDSRYKSSSGRRTPDRHDRGRYSTSSRMDDAKSSSPRRKGALSFEQIKNEREQARIREQERHMREVHRQKSMILRHERIRQRDVERQQCDETMRLDREREKLNLEKQKLEQQKLESIRMARVEMENVVRERQRLEKEREALRKLEQIRVAQQEQRRALKRSYESHEIRETASTWESKRPTITDRTAPERRDGRDNKETYSYGSRNRTTTSTLRRSDSPPPSRPRRSATPPSRGSDRRHEAETRRVAAGTSSRTSTAQRDSHSSTSARERDARTRDSTSSRDRHEDRYSDSRYERSRYSDSKTSSHDDHRRETSARSRTPPRREQSSSSSRYVESRTSAGAGSSSARDGYDRQSSSTSAPTAAASAVYSASVQRSRDLWATGTGPSSTHLSSQPSSHSILSAPSGLSSTISHRDTWIDPISQQVSARPDSYSIGQPMLGAPSSTAYLGSEQMSTIMMPVQQEARFDAYKGLTSGSSLRRY